MRFLNCGGSKIRVFAKIIFLTTFLSVFAFAKNTFADGGLVIRDPNTLQWSLQNMNEQLCAINYENGIEKMLLSVYTTDLKGEKAAWIFPVPAAPDKVKIDILKVFPNFTGKIVERVANRTIEGAFLLMRLSQIYTFPLLQSYIKRGIGGSLREGFTVAQHIEKMGLTTELISAENADQFVNYLRDKALDLPSDLQSVLKEYTGKKFSFVVSWIADIKKFKEEAKKTTLSNEAFYSLSVFIGFPTDKIYFPLKPTSVYKSTKIPMTIDVIGHVTPEFFAKIAKDSTVHYLVDDFYASPPDLVTFFNNKYPDMKLKYTKIAINAPSEYLTDDLWIEPYAPEKIRRLDLVIDYTGRWGSILFALCSCLSSLIAGMIAFRGQQPSKTKFALFGLWNFFTLLSIIAIARHRKIDERFVRKKENVNSKIDFNKPLKIAVIFSGVLLLVFISLLIFSGNVYETNIQLILGVLLVIFLVIFLCPSVPIYIFYIYRHNQNLGKFLILFSALFLFFTFITEAILRSFLSTIM